jgi:hypothetical protein
VLRYVESEILSLKQANWVRGHSFDQGLKDDLYD